VDACVAFTVFAVMFRVGLGSAARNPGLALLVATRNPAPPAVVATILAYLGVSIATITPYVAWRRRRGARTPSAGQP
jgi:hypothetical protein